MQRRSLLLLCLWKFGVENTIILILPSEIDIHDIDVIAFVVAISTDNVIIMAFWLFTHDSICLGVAWKSSVLPGMYEGLRTVL